MANGNKLLDGMRGVELDDHLDDLPMARKGVAEVEHPPCGRVPAGAGWQLHWLWQLEPTEGDLVPISDPHGAGHRKRRSSLIVGLNGSGVGRW